MPKRYEVFLSATTQKQLDKIPQKFALSLIKVLGALEKNLMPIGCKKLKNRKEYRVRQGDYRILYTISPKESAIHVIGLGYRKDVYG